MTSRAANTGWHEFRVGDRVRGGTITEFATCALVRTRVVMGMSSGWAGAWVPVDQIRTDELPRGHSMDTEPSEVA